MHSKFEAGMFTYSIFIDFQKAFDAVYQNILLKKKIKKKNNNKNYNNYNTGIRGIVNDWCDSCLTDSVQPTLVGPVLSIKISSSCGVHPC